MQTYQLETFLSESFPHRQTISAVPRYTELWTRTRDHALHLSRKTALSVQKDEHFKTACSRFNK